MESRKDYLLLVAGLKLGTHQYHIDLDNTFVNQFEEGEDTKVKDLTCKVDLTKTSGHMDIILSLQGWIVALCDRCLASIEIPIDFTYHILVKYDDEYRDDGDIIYMPRTQSELNLKTVLYDVSRMAVPRRKIIDCESQPNPPCDQKILNKLESKEDLPVNKNIWESLKSEINK